MQNRPTAFGTGLRRAAWVGLAIALASAAPAAAQSDYIVFKSPSGNILCGLYSGDDSGVRCDIAQYTPTYTNRPSNCEFDWGPYFWVGFGSGAGELACVSDAVGSLDEALELPYGQSISRGGLTCQSERTGMTCTNAMGHGFMVSKAVQKLF